MKHIYILSVLSVSACIIPPVPPAINTPEVHGLPVNENAVQQVYGYIDDNGPAAFGMAVASPLAAVRSIDFVAAPFRCDPSAPAMCLGITQLSADGAQSTVSLIEDTYGAVPTDDVRCTALAHELTHTLSWQLTGDGDADHKNPALWSGTGLVQRALDTLCPVALAQRYADGNP